MTSKVFSPTHQVFQGDCLDVLPTLAADSVDLIVTSPPYNVGKDYGNGCSDQRPWPEYYAWMGRVS